MTETAEEAKVHVTQKTLCRLNKSLKQPQSTAKAGGKYETCRNRTSTRSVHRTRASPRTIEKSSPVADSIFKASLLTAKVQQPSSCEQQPMDAVFGVRGADTQVVISTTTVESRGNSHTTRTIRRRAVPDTKPWHWKPPLAPPCLFLDTRRI
ncbi:hypothetical protein KM043_013523 [Ampulex compressa]|nr:hypothetical protein KM043_013523 [Ampulex compressa]